MPLIIILLALIKNNFVLFLFLIIFIQIFIINFMDNYDLYKIWYVIMKALEYGPLKNDIVHLDQVIENKVAHHHIEYKGKKFYVKITNKS